MGGGTQAFNAARARARLLPTANQIVSANATAQATFLQVFANVTFPATFSQPANDREENLNDFYFASKQKDVQANVVMICSILDSVHEDPHDDYIDVQDEGLVGLPISIMTRLCIIHSHPIPQHNGAPLRTAVKAFTTPFIFDDANANQMKMLMKKEKQQKLSRLSENAAKASATPSADSLDGAKLFTGVFDKVFKSPDTLMLEISTYCALHYGTQIAIPQGQAPAITLAAVLVKANLDYSDTSFYDKDSDHNRLEIVFTIASRWMLRSRSIFRKASPPIPWPGVPAEAADLAETLSLVQDLDNAEDPLGPLELMSQALSALGGYYTESDTADDVTYRTFFMLRFSGFSSQRIADQVKHMADNGMNGTVTPDEFIQSFDTIPPMAPLQNVTNAPIGIGVAAPAASVPFLSHQVAAANLSGHKINGHTLDNLRDSNGAAWIGIRVLDSRGVAGIVTGTLNSQEFDEDETWFAVAMADKVDDPCTTAAADVYKWHLAYQAKESAADFKVTPGAALALALAHTPHVKDASGDHRSDQMLTTKQLDVLGAALGTRIPGAASSIPTSYSGAQMDDIIASQLIVPTSSRSAASQLQTMNWINQISSHINPETGTVVEKYHDRSPAASTALNSIMERKLTTLRKTRMEFFLNHSDLLLMMRCRHCDLDLTRFQVQEKGVKKPPPFADTHSGLTLFILALRRAKSLEIGVDEDHNAGWDYLIKQAEDLLERGFALATLRKSIKIYAV